MKPVITLSPAEVSKLYLAHLPYRTRLIITLMLDAGLRVAETAKLRLSDIWIDNNPVKSLEVRAEIAKNKSSRIIPVSERLREAIGAYCHHKILVMFPDPLEFVFKSNEPGEHLSVRQIYRIVQKTTLTTIGRGVNPHALRHTFATRLMAKTNSRVVQALLGHKNLSSTQIYTHPNYNDLDRAIDNLD